MSAGEVMSAGSDLDVTTTGYNAGHLQIASHTKMSLWQQMAEGILGSNAVA
jgi:hypothetical protein